MAKITWISSLNENFIEIKDQGINIWIYKKFSKGTEATPVVLAVVVLTTLLRTVLQFPQNLRKTLDFAKDKNKKFETFFQAEAQIGIRFLTNNCIYNRRT